MIGGRGELGRGKGEIYGEHWGKRHIPLRTFENTTLCDISKTTSEKRPIDILVWGINFRKKAQSAI